MTGCFSCGKEIGPELSPAAQAGYCEMCFYLAGKQTEEKRDFISGVTSTKQPRLSLIPHAGLVNAAERFELGLQKHGDKAWNNLSKNQAALHDREWLIERCSHAIEHCYRLIDFLKLIPANMNVDSFGGELAKGDAGAIAWAGLVLGEALCGRQKENNLQAGAAQTRTPKSYLEECASGMQNLRQQKEK